MLSSARRPLFYLIAASLPFFLLLMAELVLRLSGYGSNYPLFIASEQAEGYLEPNPAVMQRYFAPAQAPRLSMDTQLIRQSKTPGSLRIVIQGGSTAAGFPYGRFGSVQAMLTQLLKQHYPEHDIEVINTAMAAVNSYSLLDFQSDILALEPDIVLIYAGHNEFLGIMGAGSALSPAGGRATSLLLLKLRQIRLFQLLRNLLSASASPAEANNNRSMMAQIAQGADIPTDSPLYQATLNQFHDNMALLLQRYQQEGIPVLLSNLVSNERDLVPFSAVSAANWPELLPVLKQANSSLPTAVSDNPAGRDFALGQQALAQQQLDRAQSLLQLARDNDSLRFRAPAVFNQILAQLAAQYQATLVDTEQLFRRHSTDALIGNSLLLEHVHPNVKGYQLLAAAFYRSLEQQGLLAGQQATGPLRLNANDIPLTELDIRYAELKIDNLLRQYPFTSETLPAEPFTITTELDQLLKQRVDGAPWLTVQRQLLRYYQQQQDLSGSSKTLAMLADALPFDTDLWQETGLMYLQQGELQLANYYLYHALRQQPDNLRYLLNMAHLRFVQQRYQQSLQLLEKAAHLAPEDKQVRFYRNKVQAQLAGPSRGTE